VDLITKADDERLEWVALMRGSLRAALEEVDILRKELSSERKISDACRNDASRNGEECATWKNAALENSASARSLRADLAAALAQLADEKQKVANLEEYMLKGVAFRDELQGQLAEKEGQLCKAREALLDAEYSLDSWRMQREREGVFTEIVALRSVRAALASSSPCRHEEEAKRMRIENERLSDSLRVRTAQRDEAENELRRRSGLNER